jgi:hypothetical protein
MGRRLQPFPAGDPGSTAVKTSAVTCVASDPDFLVLSVMTSGQSIRPFAVKQGLDGTSEVNAANPIPVNFYVPTIA